MKLFSRTELAFGGVAIVMHVAALYGAHLVPATNLLVQREYLPLDLIELDASAVEQQKKEEAAERPQNETASANIDRRTETERRDNRRLNPNARINPDPSNADNPGAHDSADTGPGQVETGTDPNSDFSAPEGNTIPGLGPSTGPIWTDKALMALDTTAPAAPNTAPKEKKADRDSANRLIKDQLRKKDKKLGLDLPAAGTVASIIKSAVLGSDAPATVTANFEVKLGPGGTVTSVRVVSHSDGSAAMWSAIASSAKGAIAARKLTLTEDYKKGAVIIVNVHSKMQMPSGAEVGAGIKLSLTQNFDVADIGANPVRQVTAPFSVSPVN